MPRLVGVPGYDGVLIHFGNKPEDTEGCVLIAQEYNPLQPDWISSSQKLFTTFYPAVVKAIEQNQGCTITLENHPVQPTPKIPTVAKPKQK